MRIVVSGASGFVGGELTAALRQRGHQVTTLVRRPVATSREHRWDPTTGDLDPSVISGADAVVNLNGRNIGGGRWDTRVKDELRSSRLDATRTVVGAIARSETPPGLLINASATGYYGDRGNDELDENAARGDGFLAELAADWEESAAGAASERTRVVALRLGMVLGDGGALAKMLTPFRLGLGGPMGNGRQYWPWIAIGDVCGAVEHILATPAIRGPANLVAPEAVTSKEFARALGKQLGRPAMVPAPAFALKLAMGEMADALLLSSTRAVPKVLQDTGYVFGSPTLTSAFDELLG